MENKISSDAFVNGNGKVHLTETFKISGKQIAFEFNKFYYQEILNLLVNVHENVIILPELQVKRLLMVTLDGFLSMPSNMGKNGFLETLPVKVYTEFIYKDVIYIADLFFETNRTGKMCYYITFSHDEKATPDENVGFGLLSLAFCNTSLYKTGCVEIYHSGDRLVISNLDVTRITPPAGDLDKIFIKAGIKECISRFIYTFENYDTFKTPLKYLLSGKPGLGKTEVMRAVIDKCSKHGLVIIPTEMNGAECLLFKFGKLFSPALICIDDIDLTLGSRDNGFNKKALSTFLSEMDGIVQNQIFVIATTNDKMLVDIAASRPGRFDEIIDFGEFDKVFYLDLIRQRTDDECIISLFDESILKLMDSKKVTGAFIVNLVKQLKIMTKMNPYYSKSDLQNYLNSSYKGFYKKQEEGKALGF